MKQCIDFSLPGHPMTNSQLLHEMAIFFDVTELRLLKYRQIDITVSFGLDSTTGPAGSPVDVFSKLGFRIAPFRTAWLTSEALISFPGAYPRDG